MQRKYGIPLLVAVLVCFSFGLRWQATGGNSEALNFSDSRVQTVLRFAGDNPRAKNTVTRGTLVRAWLVDSSVAGESFHINMGFEYNNHLWLVTVAFDSHGEPVSYTHRSWTRLTVSYHLQTTAIVLAVVWFIRAFIVPLFGAKCPDCTTNPLLPVVAQKRDEIVFAGGRDIEGYSLAPIIERSYVCQKCGYEKVTYIVPHTRKSASPRDTIDLSPVGVDLWKRFPMDRMLDREERAKHLTFKTFDEWQAFYDQLKIKEGERRRPISE